jgi:M6 family metalloprotease-like protein
MASKMISFLILVMGFLPPFLPPAYGEIDPLLGPQSALAVGEKRVLVAVTKFSDAQPSKSMEELKKKIFVSLNTYLQEQSYGLTSIKVDFRGWIRLPDPLSDYKISPYNYKVDKNRVRKFVEDTMSAMEKEVDFTNYDQILIIPGVQTSPGQGYGMICYCANPGMLSGVTKRYVPRFETLRTKGGKEFQGGVSVGAENAHLGMLAHDYIHTLGGIQDGKRLAPCLYDFERQSDAKAGKPSFENHAIFMGPWDIMSQHLVEQGKPCPGLSSFTKIRLGWISQEKVFFLEPGKTGHIFLTPLSQNGNKLVVKIPLGRDSYYLIENRQPIGYDKVLPDSGIIILKVNTSVPEGYGTVRVMNADPNTKNFYRATYKPGINGRNIYLDKDDNIAVIPLWMERDNLGVLITTGDKGPVALKAAASIQDLMKKGRLSDRADQISKAVAAFEAYEFEQAYAIATGPSGNN